MGLGRPASLGAWALVWRSPVLFFVFGRTTHFDGKRFKDADTRAYQAHGLGRTRRESADCNTLWAKGSVCKKRGATQKVLLLMPQGLAER